jgi:hypothetical protein
MWDKTTVTAKPLALVCIINGFEKSATEVKGGCEIAFLQVSKASSCSGLALSRTERPENWDKFTVKVGHHNQMCYAFQILWKIKITNGLFVMNQYDTSQG